MKIIVLGATSTIARELVRQLATAGDEFLLAARDAEAGAALASDLHIRTGARAIFSQLDATALAGHAEWMQRAITTLGGLDGVILCFGELGDPETSRREWSAAERVIDINFSAAVALLEPAATELERRQAGYILALSSVAGERGRAGNYLYGAAKAALTIFLEGLAHRLAPSGVRVKIAKLGFVESRMSRGIPMPAPLRATPEQAARGIVRLLRSSAQSAYIPWFWFPIMKIIRFLPTRIFNRTKL